MMIRLDAIKYYTKPETPYGKMTKTQEHITHTSLKPIYILNFAYEFYMVKLKKCK